MPCERARLIWHVRRPTNMGKFRSLMKREGSMVRLLIVALILASGTLPAAAQTTDGGFEAALSPSLAAVAKAKHAPIPGYLAQAAASMPVHEAAFRPDPTLRTF